LNNKFRPKGEDVATSETISASYTIPDLNFIASSESTQKDQQGSSKCEQISYFRYFTDTDEQETTRCEQLGG
jgi:hypothetical protein